jgi:molybdopterin converting factor small subunit
LARVVVTSGLRGDFPAVPGEFEIDARTVFELVSRLDERWPGVAELLGTHVSVAVDGELVADWSQSLERSSEVLLVPHIAGG